MKIASVSEFKAKLAGFLRLVKGGETLEIQERGVPVAVVNGVKKKADVIITPPRKDPRGLRQLKFTVRPQKLFDVVEGLLADRRRR